MKVPPAPASRLRDVNTAPTDERGNYVLYWMIANRRTRSNFALQHAVHLAQTLRKPLLVFEPLRASYPWASDRFHAFVIEGMRDQARSCEAAGVAYYPYVEPRRGAARGLLRALADRACRVVTDDLPGFFLPRMIAAVAPGLPVRTTAVDAAGLLPVAAGRHAFARAHDFRRHLQKELPRHLLEMPVDAPLAHLDPPRRRVLPSDVLERWPAASPELLALRPQALAALPIDHRVGVAPHLRGGEQAASTRLARFVAEDLPRYASGRNHPDDDHSSRLSPYLHFGHIGPHQVLVAVARSTDWTLDRLGERATGARAGWWGMPPDHEAFLDELVTWRELGLNFCFHRPDYAEYDSLPDWAQQTLGEHAKDPRRVYPDDVLEEGRTDDAVWNAAQLQLRREGVMHNYLRMLWGKKLLEWSATPRQALQRMIQWNNRYALDGRDANSYSGIFWVLGRYDRAWGPERSIFGKVRFMTSESTQRKLRMKQYLARYRP